MSKGKDKQDPRVHYGEPPETWLWDLYPLADGAWRNIQYSANYFKDWGTEPGTTISIRRWVTGPNGPSFLTEYTPADDYITEGYNGRHATYNGLYQDEDRPCYVPEPDDLERVGRLFPKIAHAGNPPWPRVEAELVAAGRSRDELAKMNAPTLLLLLAQTRGATAPAAADDKRPRCAPMSRAEIARRLLNKTSARTRDALALMERHGLRQESGSNLWTIYVDNLDPMAKERLLRPGK
jgi:hypothetical protein